MANSVSSLEQEFILILSLLNFTKFSDTLLNEKTRVVTLGFKYTNSKDIALGKYNIDVPQILPHVVFSCNILCEFFLKNFFRKG